MKTPAEQIRKIARDVGEQAQFHYTWDSTVDGYLKVTAGKLQALADYLESDPSGGLREIATKALALLTCEPEGELRKMAFIDGRMEWYEKAKIVAVDLRKALAATPKPPESAGPGSEG